MVKNRYQKQYVFMDHLLYVQYYAGLQNTQQGGKHHTMAPRIYNQRFFKIMIILNHLYVPLKCMNFSI